MNRDDDFSRTLEAWLRREAPSQAPDRLLDAALERVAAEPQWRGGLERLLGDSRGRTLIRAAALTAVIAIAVLVGLQLSHLGPDVGGPATSPTTSASPSASPSRSPTPSVVPSGPTLPSLSPAIGCVDSPPDVAVIFAVITEQTGPVACFGNAPMTFDVYLTGAGAVDCPGSVEPSWLYCPSDGWLELVGETRKVGAPFLLVAENPTGHVSLRAYLDMNVRVTGHFDDPASQTCREIEPIPGESPRPAAEVIASCRNTFVVTAVVPLGL